MLNLQASLLLASQWRHLVPLFDKHLKSDWVSIVGHRQTTVDGIQSKSDQILTFTSQRQPAGVN